MAAQDYISGQAADFDYFQDQLENCMFLSLLTLKIETLLTAQLLEQ